jgi:hypothetical protein
VVFNRAPVNDEATQGESVLTLLQSGIDPSMLMRRELDGQGGAYKHQLDAALGRFARIDANLSFNFTSFSNANNYKFSRQGSNASVFLADNGAKSLSVDIDGSGNDDRATVRSTVPLRIESLRKFRLTFKNIQFTSNNTDNFFSVGFHSKPRSNVDATSGGNGFLFDSSSDFFDTDTGGKFPAGFSSGNDISFEYNGVSNNATGLINGSVEGEINFSKTGDFVPFVQVFDDGNNSSSESFSVDQITVEPLGGIE